VRVNERKGRNCYLVDLGRSARKLFVNNFVEKNFYTTETALVLIELPNIFSRVFCVIIIPSKNYFSFNSHQISECFLRGAILAVGFGREGGGTDSFF
jgi:hypothetical protein